VVKARLKENNQLRFGFLNSVTVESRTTCKTHALRLVSYECNGVKNVSDNSFKVPGEIKENGSTSSVNEVENAICLHDEDGPSLKQVYKFEPRCF